MSVALKEIKKYDGAWEVYSVCFFFVNKRKIGRLISSILYSKKHDIEFL